VERSPSRTSSSSALASTSRARGCWRGGVLTPPAQVAAPLRYKGTAFLVRSSSDYVDGRLGLGFLLLGFGCQAIGYLVLLERRSSALGWDDAITALILLAAAMALPWLVWLLVEAPMRRRYLVELAHWERGVRYDLPELHELTRYAGALGEKRRPDEYEGEDGQIRYVQRVLGVRGPFR
jgi:hypothetical protein